MTYLQQQQQALRSFHAGSFSRSLRVTAIAFIAVVLLSFCVGMVSADLTDKIVAQFAKQVADLGIVQDDGSLQFLGLFSNNFQAMLTGVIYGLVPVIYLPALPLGINASLLGLFAAYYIHHDVSLLYYLVSILPHGIFELPALVISLSVGMHLCRCTTRAVFKKEQGQVVPALKDAAREIIMVVLPLLLIAAVVESYVTPLLIRLLN